VLARNDVQGFRGVRGRGDLMADPQQDALDGAAIQLLIVDDEDGRRRQGLQGGLRLAEGAAAVYRSLASRHVGRTPEPIRVLR